MESRAGKEDEHIVGLAEELEVDLIVVGSRGPGEIKHAVMGSVSERCAPRPLPRPGDAALVAPTHDLMGGDLNEHV